MGLNLLILALRVAAMVLLYLFLLAAVAVIWRDWRAVTRQIEETRQSATQTLGRLVVIDGGGTDLMPGQSFPLGVTTGLGRAASNTVIVDDPFASSEHALLSRRGGRWWLEDQGSKNGTFLNGQRLTAPAIVTTGDELGIGGARLRIELGGS
jgi:pSer/pThr/pTyr-binding forkhead associated (FHA) protein